MKNRTRWSLAGIAAVAVVGAIAGVLYIRAADRDLSEVPPRHAGSALPPQEFQSTIWIPIALNEKVLTDAANAMTPVRISIPKATARHSEEVDDPACVAHNAARRLIGKSANCHRRITLYSVSADTEGLVTRDVPIVVTAQDNGLALRTKVFGALEASQAGITQTARGVADVGAFIKLDIAPDWTALAQVVPPKGWSKHYVWVQRPETRLFNVIPISLGSRTEAILDKEIDTFKSSLPSFIQGQLPLKDLMSAVWNKAHTVVQVSTKPKVWMSIDPVAIHFGSPTTANGDLLLNLAITSKVSVSTSRPVAPVPELLPALDKVLPSPGFKVVVPTAIGYDAISAELSNAFADQPLRLEEANGQSTISIRHVRVYPAGKRLVVGIKIDADLPNTWLDTRGWVYFLATPEYDPKRRSLVLKSIDFARSVDNRIARATTAALREVLRNKLRRIAVVDLRELLDSAQSKANRYLTSTLESSVHKMGESQGIPAVAGMFARADISGGVNALDSVQIQISDNELTVIPTVSGDFRVAFTPALSAKRVKASQSAVTAPFVASSAQ